MLHADIDGEVWRGDESMEDGRHLSIRGFFLGPNSIHATCALSFFVFIHRHAPPSAPQERVHRRRGARADRDRRRCNGRRHDRHRRKAVTAAAIFATAASIAAVAAAASYLQLTL